MSNLSTIYKKVKTSKTTKDFLRDSYIELYSASDAPEIIDTVKFSEVFVNQADFLHHYSYCNVKYSADIGYDYEEQYVDEERYYDSNLKEYRTRNVIKNKTVTKWQPYNGSAENICAGVYKVLDDGDKPDLGDSEFCFDDRFLPQTIIAGAETEILTEEELNNANLKALPESEHRVLLKTLYSSGNFIDKVSLPGEKHRNFNAQWDSENMHASYTFINRYKLAFECDGHKGFIKQFETEKHPNIYCSHKYKDSETKELEDSMQKEIDSNEEYQKNAKMNKYGTMGSLGFGFLAFIISFLADLSALGFIGIAIAVIGFIVSYKVFGKKAQAISDAIKAKYTNMITEHNTFVKNRKIELLNARFAKLGLEPLTDEELLRFSPENEHKLIDNDLSEYDDENPEDLDEEEEK